MTEDPVLSGLREILESMGIERPVDASTQILGDLELDSLRRIELVIEVENRFRVCLEPEDEASVRTLGDLARVIGARGGPGDPPRG